MLRQPETASAMRSEVILNADMTAVEELRECGGRIALYSARAPEKDTNNEDAAGVFCLDEDALVLVVADGMGGAPQGEQASAIAVESTRSRLQLFDSSTTSIREAILDGIEDANRSIGALGVGAGTTFVAVEITKGHVVRTYHAGDSEVLVTGQRGKLKLQTLSHSPTSYAVEAGFLDAREAIQHEDRHLVSNALGTPEMRIEIGVATKLSRHDTLLVASDGLFDNLHLHEITDIVRKGPLAQALTALIDQCRQRMLHPAVGYPSKLDDLTVILYRRSR